MPREILLKLSVLICFFFFSFFLFGRYSNYFCKRSCGIMILHSVKQRCITYNNLQAHTNRVSFKMMWMTNLPLVCSWEKPPRRERRTWWWSSPAPAELSPVPPDPPLACPQTLLVLGFARCPMHRDTQLLILWFCSDCHIAVILPHFNKGRLLSFLVWLVVTKRLLLCQNGNSVSSNLTLPTWTLPGCSWCAPPYGDAPPPPEDWGAPQVLNPHSALESTLSEAWTATK